MADLKTPEFKFVSNDLRPKTPHFYSEGRHIFQSPLTHKGKTSLGFRVLSINENITDGAEVAVTLTKLMNTFPELFADD